MIIDLNDSRHNDFTDNEQVACFQFWSQKCTPIYYKDSVVVLQQMPASGADSANNKCRPFVIPTASTGQSEHDSRRSDLNAMASDKNQDN